MPVVKCPKCKGTGTNNGEECDRCHGSGTIWIDSGSGW